MWEGHADGKCLVFADIHAAMAELRSGQEALVERRLAAMRETAASDAEAAASIALSAFRWSRVSRRSTAAPTSRRSSCCCRSFRPWQIGGSHAQRDVVDWTLTEAAVRAGQRDVALSLAHERLGARPRSAANRRFHRQAEPIAA